MKSKKGPFKMGGMHWKEGQSPIKNIDAAIADNLDIVLEEDLGQDIGQDAMITKTPGEEPTPIEGDDIIEETGEEGESGTNVSEKESTKFWETKSGRELISTGVQLMTSQQRKATDPRANPIGGFGSLTFGAGAAPNIGAPPQSRPTSMFTKKSRKKKT